MLLSDQVCLVFFIILIMKVYTLPTRISGVYDKTKKVFKINKRKREVFVHYIKQYDIKSMVSQTRYLTFVINYLYMNLYLMEIYVDQMNIFVFCMTDICINIQNCQNFGSRQSKTFQPFGSLVSIIISKITKRTVICVQKTYLI